MASKIKWGKWSAREDCIVSGGKIRTKRPKGASYQGMNERGTIYFRKKDDKFFIQTRKCKGGKNVYVEL